RRDEHTGDFKKASGMDDIIELNFDLPEVRTAMIDAMKFWIIESGIDGFRCDLAYWVQLDFWLEAKPKIEEVKPLFWLGELDSLDNPEYMQVFDAAYTWRWMHKAEHFYKQNLYIGELVNVLEQYQQAPGSKAWFTSNHDENSWNGTEYEKYGEMAQALAVFSCTWPGVPLIYSGQELPNHKRLQFFEKDIIEWKEHFQLHDFYKKLLTFKQETPALSALAPVRIIQTNAGDKLLTFSRGQNEVIVMINFSGDTVNVQLDIEPANYTDLFSGEKFQLTASTNLNIEKWGWMIICS
ncbi:MAG TPA: alpha-amylase family glycosyl hydrolase, partial [Flavisolibacter sp.]|nr:alpha-amylase family glycosyl hydrolase [Flavisolibacter sp.]